MLMGELGRYPIEVTIKSRMIGNWYRLLTGKQTKLAYTIYQTMIRIPNFQSKWIPCIQNILAEIGRMDLWNNQNNLPQYSIKRLIKQILIDQYKQNWHSSLQLSSKGQNYSLFKDTLKLEDFFTSLSRGNYINLTKFRTSNHYLPVEVGLCTYHLLLCFIPFFILIHQLNPLYIEFIISLILAHF